MVGAGLLGASEEEAEFDGQRVYAGEKEVTLQDVAYKGTCGNTQELQVISFFLFTDFPAAIYGGNRRSRGR